MADKKREEIATLLRAGNGPKDIVANLGTTRSTILCVQKRIEASKSPHPSPRKVKKPTKRTPWAMGAVMWRVRKDLTKAISVIARETGLTRTTTSHIIKMAGGQSLRQNNAPFSVLQLKNAIWNDAGPC